jgi:hypothetical protein
MKLVIVQKNKRSGKKLLNKRRKRTVKKLARKVKTLKRRARKAKKATKKRGLFSMIFK